MADIVMYSNAFCPFCMRARQLFKAKGVAFEEIDILAQPRRRQEMLERAGGRTSVPQIFIDDQHIGGSDELVALDRAGRLDGLLGLD